VISILYHDVVRSGAFDSSGFVVPGADLYKLDSQVFDEQLKRIADQARIRPTSLETFPVEPHGHQFLFTFDDGGATAYSVIADSLERHGWRGHFFVATDYIGTRRFLSRCQIRELRSRGHVIASHSCSHPPQMSRCRPSQLHREWTQSVSVLEDILGEVVRVASVPGGFYSRQVAEAAAAAGIQVLFTSRPTRKCHWVDELLVLGRYTIRAGTASHVAAKLASGHWLECLKQSVCWNAKGVLKRIGGRHYAKLRNIVLSAASQPSGGRRVLP